jgi:hypothetical protein
MPSMWIEGAQSLGLTPSLKDPALDVVGVGREHDECKSEDLDQSTTECQMKHDESPHPLADDIGAKPSLDPEVLSCESAHADSPYNCRKTNSSHGWKTSLFGLVVFQSQGGVPKGCMLPSTQQICTTSVTNQAGSYMEYTKYLE